MSVQLLSIHGVATTLTVESRDASIDLSKLTINIAPASDEDIESAYASDPNNTKRLIDSVMANFEPYKRTRCGFGASE